MDNRIFHGPYGVVVTPFKENGNVDFKELEKQLDIVCDSGKSERYQETDGIGR